MRVFFSESRALIVVRRNYLNHTEREKLRNSMDLPPLNHHPPTHGSRILTMPWQGPIMAPRVVCVRPSAHCLRCLLVRQLVVLPQAARQSNLTTASPAPSPPQPPSSCGRVLPPAAVGFPWLLVWCA